MSDLGPMETRLSDDELEARYTFVPWREPIRITVGDVTRLGCRLCIAQYGLAASDVGRLFLTAAEHGEHVATFHPL